MIKDFLEDLKGNNRLTNCVLDHYIDESVDYESTDDLLRSMEELQQYGCVSGMIGELIYYDDTEKLGGAKSFASTLQETQNKSRKQTNSCLFTRKEELLSNNTNKAISTFITFKKGGRGLNLLSSSFRKNISSMSKMNLCGGGAETFRNFCSNSYFIISTCEGGDKIFS